MNINTHTSATANEGTKLSPREVQKYTKAWQTVLPKDLPNLFYSYDESEGQTERVVSFKLSGKPLREFLATQPEHIIVHLAKDPSLQPNQVHDSPPFSLILQGYSESIGTYEGSFKMAWEPNPPFLKSDDDSTNNGVDQIPAEGAYLFVLSWLETNYHDLIEPFENIAANLVQRVKFYRFSLDETYEILKMLKENIADATLYIHLGKGLSVTKHPFSFRPVLEVHIDSESTRSDDDGRGGFYDFSNPCPPLCN